MIEKKIHYVWMGNNEKPEFIIKCMNSWKKHLSDYEIIEWNEDNFDIASNQFLKEAYENKKWAFVSDYVRLKVLEEHGGIYLDTDMEILKSFNPLLQHRVFMGFETKNHLLTGMLATEKGHPLLKDLLKYYENRSFYNEDGRIVTTPNVVHITNTLQDIYGLQVNSQYQVLKEDIHIYPKEFFCPSNFGDNEKKGHKKATNNTYCIHHFYGSWLSPLGKLKMKIRGIIGEENVDRIKKIIK